MNDNFNTRMILTTAVFAAVAALLVGPASAYVMDVEGGGGSGTSVTAQPDAFERAVARAMATQPATPGVLQSAVTQALVDNTVEPGTIPYLSHGIGVDQSQFSGTVDELDPAIRTAIAAEAAAKLKAQASAAPGAIPYLSHGIGVDQSLYQGEQSLGLTGDSPITRVVGQEPAGLTGDSPRTRWQPFQANATSASNSDSDVNWTWVGFGVGMAALLAAAMGALYLSARHRDRVALP
jgi:hypothetical protein